MNYKKGKQKTVIVLTMYDMVERVEKEGPKV